MEHKYLHVFHLKVDGLSEPVEFRMFLERDDVADATDAMAQYVARQEDNFLPLGIAAAVRASRVFHVAHVSARPATDEERAG
jgi:hypothetical protein